MSTSGTLRAPFAVNVINNLSEGIWMQGTTLPAGLRIVIGQPREGGWIDVDFQMGLRNQFTGRAIVPQSYVQPDPLPAAVVYGVGAMLPGILRPSVMSRRGLGAAGASEFTVKAAEELDEHLTTNGCAGCSDYKSTLRQLAFKFKAACMTDPAIQNQVSFNMSTPLSMTAYGTGTDKALSLVLGVKRTYDGGPCTDDLGSCLSKTSPVAEVTPVALAPLIEQVVLQVQNGISQHAGQPAATQLDRQKPLVDTLEGVVRGLLEALSSAISKLYPQQTTPVVQVSTTPSPAPAPKTEEKKIPWGTIAIGGALGALVIGTGVILYKQAESR